MEVTVIKDGAHTQRGRPVGVPPIGSTEMVSDPRGDPPDLPAPVLHGRHHLPLTTLACMTLPEAEVLPSPALELRFRLLQLLFDEFPLPLLRPECLVQLTNPLLQSSSVLPVDLVRQLLCELPDLVLQF